MCNVAVHILALPMKAMLYVFPLSHQCPTNGRVQQGPVLFDSKHGDVGFEMHLFKLHWNKRSATLL